MAFRLKEACQILTVTSEAGCPQHVASRRTTVIQVVQDAVDQFCAADWFADLHKMDWAHDVRIDLEAPYEDTEYVGTWRKAIVKHHDNVVAAAMGPMGMH